MSKEYIEENYFGADECVEVPTSQFYIAKDGTVLLRSTPRMGVIMSKEYIENYFGADECVEVECVEENYFGADECIDCMECVEGGV